MQNQSQGRIQPNAFTLVELLVVIGIIALLISVLLPSLNKARQSANLVYCQANLRSIGQAIQIYATYNKGSLPCGTYDGVWDGWNGSVRSVNGTDFTVLLSAAAGKTGTTWGEQPEGSATGARGMFRDVDTQETTTTAPIIPGGAGGYVHYSAHPRLMGNLETDNPPFFPFTANPGQPYFGHNMPPYKLARIRPAIEVVLVFDGQQIASFGNNASVEGYGLDSSAAQTGLYDDPRTACFRRDRAQLLGINLGVSILPGPNTDMPTFTNAGNIRWRHMKNTQANFLFADGHVEAHKYVSSTKCTLMRSALCSTSRDRWQ